MAWDSAEPGLLGRALPLADDVALGAALKAANLQTLLMVYVQLTRDETMLDRFAPHIRTAYAKEPTAIPEALAEELREGLRRVLTTRGAAATGELPLPLMQKMMSVGVGEPVTDEFIPLLFDQIGFKRPLPRRDLPGRRPPPAGFKVLVIGAGMVGLAAAVKLGEAGYDYVVIEKNPEVGGTWWENRYPGVGVDTPSHFYSYSFEISPEWNHYHPQGGDMQRYLAGVADKYRLRDRIRFGTTVLRLAYDEQNKTWEVVVRNPDGGEETLRANAVINAHGPVNRWKWPAIPGRESFAGALMHTAGWDASVNLRGKRVAVIGTGASAGQLVPAIAGEVGSMVVFQRSKHWVIPNPEIATAVPEPVKWALRHIPHYREWFRFRVYWNGSDGLFINVLKDPAWTSEVSVSRHNDALRRFALRHMEKKIGDRPDLMSKLTPDFPIFSKRIIMDVGWFDALKQPNVTLETGAIARFTPTGVEMADGRAYDFDVVICATGFDVARMLGNLEVSGLGGRRLNDEWGEDDPRAYLGMTIPGYPNFFFTVGPNSAPNHAAGHNLVAEAQVHYILECLDLMTARDARAIEVRQEAFSEFNRKVDERMTEMIWTHPKARSYYNNSKGRVFLSWPWRLVDYWSDTRRPEADHYELS